MYTSIADANGNRSPLIVACSDHPQAPVSTAKTESIEGTALVHRTTWTCHECGAAVTPKAPEDS